MVLERIAEFLGGLFHGQTQMNTTLQQLMDKLTAQGAQIDKLVADRDAKEQADLDQINALIDANAAKIIGALTPSAPLAAAAPVTASVVAEPAPARS